MRHSMSVITLSPQQPFSLDQTLGCGQVFRWDKSAEGSWTGVVGRHVIRIRQDNRKIHFEGAPEWFIRDYFSLDIDLRDILSSIDRDPVIHAAIERCHGLRLVRQPPWECTVSYICSTNSNIPTIRKRIATLAKKFGQPLESRGERFYTFPEPVSVICEGDNGLTECRLGYRQPYVYKTANSVTDVQKWEEKLRLLPYEDARKELMTLQGVGPKAADCILLFAFQKYEAFPVDVWIRRILKQHYLPELRMDAPLTSREYDRIRSFAQEHFGEFCGWAQEYLYAGRLE
jgi:N-glycosylase/DNA lyase